VGARHACLTGDVGAFAHLVQRHQEAALRCAFLLTNDRLAAEDIAQEAFLNAFRHLARFDPTRPFLPWLLGIVANEARRYRRDHRRWSASLLAEDVPAEAEPPMASVIRRDERARVRAALAALAEPFRTTAVLYYVNDLSVEVIARTLGCRPGTVKSRLHTARCRLRQLLATDTDVPRRPG
jgi:RNA polymerase sigma-70 factor (ECF subfamily)